MLHDTPLRKKLKSSSSEKLHSGHQKEHSVSDYMYYVKSLLMLLL